MLGSSSQTGNAPDSLSAAQHPGTCGICKSLSRGHTDPEQTRLRPRDTPGTKVRREPRPAPVCAHSGEGPVGNTRQGRQAASRVPELGRRDTHFTGKRLSEERVYRICSQGQEFAPQDTCQLMGAFWVVTSGEGCSRPSGGRPGMLTDTRQSMGCPPALPKRELSVPKWQPVNQTQAASTYSQRSRPKQRRCPAAGEAGASAVGGSTVRTDLERKAWLRACGQAGAPPATWEMKGAACHP